jgi:putative FmdB family regulatory protein
MLYPFNCENCGEIELNLKPSQIPLKECPNCGSEKIERTFSAIPSLWKTAGAYSKAKHGNE